MDDRIVNEEYKIWKRHLTFMYDIMITHCLEWPSLTVQWLPTTQSGGKPLDHLIVGTHTSNEQNHMILLNVEMPCSDDSFDNTVYDSSRMDFGCFSGVEATIKVARKIYHEGEINRARYMPQNPQVVATISPNMDVFIFDLSKKHSASVFSPNLRLRGHTKEGYGLSWNKNRAGYLLAASDDHNICLWDVNAVPNNQTTLDSLQTYSAHTSVAEDVAWHNGYVNIFASVGDDGRLLVWDDRLCPTSPICRVAAHKGEVYCVDFNWFDDNLLATGSADKTVALWDIRNLANKLHTFESHSDDVFQVLWSPVNETILGSSGTDRRVHFWDLSKIGDEQTLEDAVDGPPELLFIHAGHTAKISDFSWHPTKLFTVCSVAEDNVVQIWQMTDNIYDDDEDEEDEKENEAEAAKA